MDKFEGQWLRVCQDNSIEEAMQDIWGSTTGKLMLTARDVIHSISVDNLNPQSVKLVEEGPYNREFTRVLGGPPVAVINRVTEGIYDETCYYEELCDCFVVKKVDRNWNFELTETRTFHDEMIELEMRLKSLSSGSVVVANSWFRRVDTRNKVPELSPRSCYSYLSPPKNHHSLSFALLSAVKGTNGFSFELLSRALTSVAFQCHYVLECQRLVKNVWIPNFDESPPNWCISKAGMMHDPRQYYCSDLIQARQFHCIIPNDYVLFREFNFSQLSVTGRLVDRCGWQYAENWEEEESRWSSKPIKTEQNAYCLTAEMKSDSSRIIDGRAKLLEHQYRRRLWIQVVIPSFPSTIKEAEESLKSYMKDNSRGVVHRGYLTKRGTLVKSWRKRLFVLTDSKLAYFDPNGKVDTTTSNANTKNQTQPVLRGGISLVGCHVEALNEADCFGKPYGMLLSWVDSSCSKRELRFLTANSEEDRREWMAILTHQATLVTPSVSYDTIVPQSSQLKDSPTRLQLETNCRPSRTLCPLLYSPILYHGEVFVEGNSKEELILRYLVLRRKKSDGQRGAALEFYCPGNKVNEETGFIGELLQNSIDMIDCVYSESADDPLSFTLSNFVRATSDLLQGKRGSDERIGQNVVRCQATSMDQKIQWKAAIRSQVLLFGKHPDLCDFNGSQAAIPLSKSEVRAAEIRKRVVIDSSSSSNASANAETSFMLDHLTNSEYGNNISETNTEASGYQNFDDDEEVVTFSNRISDGKNDHVKRRKKSVFSSISKLFRGTKSEVPPEPSPATQTEHEHHDGDDDKNNAINIVVDEEEMEVDEDKFHLPLEEIKPASSDSGKKVPSEEIRDDISDLTHSTSVSTRVNNFSNLIVSSSKNADSPIQRLLLGAVRGDEAHIVQLKESFGIDVNKIFKGVWVQKKFEHELILCKRFVWIDCATKTIHWAKSASEKDVKVSKSLYLPHCSLYCKEPVELKQYFTVKMNISSASSAKTVSSKEPGQSICIQLPRPKTDLKRFKSDDSVDSNTGESSAIFGVYERSLDASVWMALMQTLQKL